MRNAPEATSGWRGRWGLEAAERGSNPAVWPDTRQELLLKAGLFDGDDAVRAWREWKADAERHPLDPRSAQILPLVHHNLRDRAAHDSSIAALRPRYLLTWARNQKLFEVLRRTLLKLHDSGIDTLVFKGAALVPLYYGDEGARSMGDFDVLVPEERFAEAARLLRKAGWTALYWDPDRFDTRFQHAIGFVDDDGNSVDVHCHLLMASCAPGADEAFWGSSVPLMIRGVETRSLCATDHFLQACVHGMKWVKSAPLRWVADAVTVAGSAPAGVDWERLVRVCREREVSLHVAEPLEYLGRTFGLSVPAEVLRRLRESASGTERRLFLAWTSSRRGRPIPLFLHHWFMYTRGLERAGAIEHVQAIPKYLRFWAQTDRLWKIPPRLAVKGARAVGHRLGLYRYWDS
ncbi:MAG: nucleotidyltransferase family protein [Gemmatimonadetes bacterium]|nr:nucleotidyltransferase family protein [Gemmatimonadota bacterium]